MLDLRHSEDRGASRFDWLDSRHRAQATETAKLVFSSLP